MTDKFVIALSCEAINRHVGIAAYNIVTPHRHLEKLDKAISNGCYASTLSITRLKRASQELRKLADEIDKRRHALIDNQLQDTVTIQGAQDVSK